MSAPKSPHANPHCRALLNRALDRVMAENYRFGSGIQVECPTKQAAYQLRRNCYTLRLREREKNLRAFEPDHPNYGVSPWDQLSMEIHHDPSGKWMLKIWIPTVDDNRIQEL